MPTFIAQYVKKSGERGVMRVDARSSSNALINVLDLHRNVTRVSVKLWLGTPPQLTLHRSDCRHPQAGAASMRGA